MKPKKILERTREELRDIVWAIAFRPDGKQMVVAVGSRLLVFDLNSSDQRLAKILTPHKGHVFALSYSSDGKRFASGGADCTVIIWTAQADGLLQYTHGTSIQALAYNPVTQQLASGTENDIGLWSPEQKQVQKERVNSRILCMAWTNDGQFLACGQFNGIITIRDRSGAVKHHIRRPEPVWCLAWNPAKDTNTLAVGSWDQRLSFYNLNGKQEGGDHVLGFDPCSLSYFTSGEYLVIGGSNCKALLYTRDGVKLSTICESNGWIWSAVARPKHNYVATGSNDCTLSLYQLVFTTVHGLYQDRYAYRDVMTDVVVQSLTNTDQRLRIRCQDYVQKIAVFRNRLAVQLPERLVVYELLEDDQTGELTSQHPQTIRQKLDCNLLVVTSQHIILCQEKKVQLLRLSGEKENEWCLESVILYMKVIGGPPGREGLLVGLLNGCVLIIYIDNPFPITLLWHSRPVNCLDLSMSRSRLAVVDDLHHLYVYDVASKERIMHEPNVNGVSWNTEFENMFCYSGNGLLSIKVADLPVYQQKMQGLVVGLKGSKVFCLRHISMLTYDVPQSFALYRFLERKDFESAYQIACLGVTDNDWRMLGSFALREQELGIAKKAYLRVRDTKYLDLIADIELSRLQPNFDDRISSAQVLAYQGKYQEAAQLFVQAGHVDMAIEMFTDLRDYAEALIFVRSLVDPAIVKDLILKQARWCEEIGDWKAAAEIYLQAGQPERAVHILGERAWVDDLVNVMRRLNKVEVQALRACGNYFLTNQSFPYARETFLKLEDMNALAQLHVRLKEWESALQVAEGHPELAAVVNLPYASWLVEQGEFEEAHKAFKKADRADLSLMMIEELANNAVTTNHFQNAARYFWLLSRLTLEMGLSSEQETCERFEELRRLSELYYAYQYIHKVTLEPFVSQEPETIFNIARNLYIRTREECPKGISLSYTLFALAKQARNLGAFKFARQVFADLQNMRLPAHWLEQVDLASLSIRAKPYSDREDLLHVCWRCGATTALSAIQNGDACQQCGHPFIRSYYSFDVLPLVEFFVEDDITPEEAQRLITTYNPTGGNSGGGFEGDLGGWQEQEQDGAQMLTLVDEGAGPSPSAGRSEDPFMDILRSIQRGDIHRKLVLGRDGLLAIPPSMAFVQKWSPPLVPRYFRCMASDPPIVLCPSCYNFFLEEDFEYSAMKHHCCPFCRTDVSKLGPGFEKAYTQPEPESP